jgi:hypothetical protein
VSTAKPARAIRPRPTGKNWPPGRNCRHGQALPGAHETECQAFIAARDLRQPVYSAPSRTATARMVFLLHVPLLDRGSFNGALVADYSSTCCCATSCPPEVTRRHAIAVDRRARATIASSVLQMPAGPQPARRHRARRAAGAGRQRPGAARQGYRTRSA